jgi:hypothetical protein
LNSDLILIPTPRYFYYQFYGDHARADLIWNFKTREELREAIESELRAFTADKDLRGDLTISWNHTEFELRCVLHTLNTRACALTSLVPTSLKSL